MKQTYFRKSLTAAAIAASVAVPGVAFAQDADATNNEEEKVERIDVTGSRLKQVDMETSSPVTVITAEDIELSGEASVADVLNNSSVNSFGSWRGVSGYGSGAAANSEINMRGLGSNYTLVLLDGRRMPGTSSSAGTAADTSRIPMAIVERIEILREGASAVYGSDAVAGVINIITKKNFNGLAFSYDATRPSVEGGDRDRFTASTGFSTNKGNITLTYEHSEAESVFDRDLWKLDHPTYADYSTFSAVPNGVGASGWVSADFCGQVDHTVPIADGRCLYSYGEVTKFYPDNTQDSILSNFNYNLTNDIRFRGRASASMSRTDSRYAGTPVSTNFPVMAADNPLNPVGEDLTLYMRSAQIGERDTRTEINTVDFLGGLVGFMDVGNGIDWELNGQYSFSTTRSFNTNLINDDIIQTEIDKGIYDVFNTTGMAFDDWYAQLGDLYAKAAHTGVYQAEFESTQFDGFVSTLLFANDSMTLAGLVGAELESIDFTQVSDPQSASGRVSGGSGGDDVFATRDRTSIYAEVQATLPANFEVNAAVRYDDYEQEGDVGDRIVSGNFDNVSPQIGAAWRPTDSVLVRASWGESFRAPNMGEMFSSQALSFPSALDALWCNDPNNSDPNYCRPQQQHKTWFGGNPDLLPEDGESFTTGVVWNVTDNFSMELSYYAIELNNKIAAISIARLLADEQEGGINSNPAVVRDPATGKIDTMYSFDRNMAQEKTSGYDFKANYAFSNDMGDFGIRAEASYVNEYESKADANSTPFDTVGIQDFPELRANATLSWSKGDFGAAWTTYYVGPQDSGNEEYGVTYLAEVPSYVKHNVQFSYSHAYNGKVTLGVNNAFDKEGPTWYDGFVGYRDSSWTLYDLTGRTVFLKVEQSF